MGQFEWHEFASSEALAETLSSQVAGALARAIEQRGAGFLAVSGGTTPTRFLRALSTRPIGWTHVTVTLVDERFVPETSERSNAALIKSTLLRNEAAAARFVGLYRPEGSVEQAAISAAADLAALPWPLDAAVLGMGTDGHTASFFPDAANLADLLRPHGDELVLPVHAQSAGEPRLTLPLARLIEADFLALHIEGAQKRAVLERALGGEDHLPVASIFQHAGKPVRIYWTP